MAAVNCTLCGVSMATAERNYTRRNTPASLHNDCAVLEDLQYWTGKWYAGNPSELAVVNGYVARLTAKKSGQPTNFP